MTFNRRILSISMVLSILAVLAILMNLSSTARAEGDDRHQGRHKEKNKPPTSSPVGSWFGRAVPDCSGAPGCPIEVVMQPTLHPPHDPTIPEGIVTATDSGLIPPHTTALGTWVQKDKDDNVCPNRTDRYEATFMWFQGVDPAQSSCIFQGSVRTRFITCFDKKNPDQMEGTLEPFFFNYVDPKTCKVKLGSDGFPSPDPLGEPLPETCNGLDEAGNGCPFTAHFVIRRISVQKD